MHRSRRVLQDEREDLERLAQYIVRNPFSVEKMRVNQAGDAITYRSEMNEKIHRNPSTPLGALSKSWYSGTRRMGFEVFSPCDFIAAVTPCPPKQAKREGGCPRCSHEMRIVSLIDDPKVIERILRHLGLWDQDVRVCSSTGPPASAHRELVLEPWLACPPELEERRGDDPLPDYDTEPVLAYANN